MVTRSSAANSLRKIWNGCNSFPYERNRMNERQDTTPSSIYLATDAEERTKLSEDRIELSIERKQLSEERVELSQERIELSQERVELAGERIELAEERTDLAAERRKGDGGGKVAGVPPIL
jgi:hypothetical protein